jgi:hypothetical protein
MADAAVEVCPALLWDAGVVDDLTAATVRCAADLADQATEVVDRDTRLVRDRVDRAL